MVRLKETEKVLRIEKKDGEEEEKREKKKQRKEQMEEVKGSLGMVTKNGTIWRIDRDVESGWQASPSNQRTRRNWRLSLEVLVAKTVVSSAAAVPRIESMGDYKFNLRPRNRTVGRDNRKDFRPLNQGGTKRSAFNSLSLLCSGHPSSSAFRNLAPVPGLQAVVKIEAGNWRHYYKTVPKAII